MRARALRHFDQFAANCVHMGDVPCDVRMIRAEALQVVVEMRQVNQRQGGAILPEHMLRAAPDPVRRCHVGRRAPEPE